MHHGNKYIVMHKKSLLGLQRMLCFGTWILYMGNFGMGKIGKIDKYNAIRQHFYLSITSYYNKLYSIQAAHLPTLQVVWISPFTISLKFSHIRYLNVQILNKQILNYLLNTECCHSVLHITIFSNSRHELLYIL